MKHRLATIATVLFMTTTAQTLCAAELKESPYYPMAIGTEWVYTVTVGGEVQTLTMKITQNADGTFCF